MTKLAKAEINLPTVIAAMFLMVLVGVVVGAVASEIDHSHGKVTNYCDTGKQNRIYVYEGKFQVVYDPTCETE